MLSGGVGVVESVDCVRDFRTQFENCGPLLAFKELCLHAASKRFDHSVAIAIPNCYVSEPEAVLSDIPGEGPSSKLVDMVGVHNSPGDWLPYRVRDEQSRVHQTGLSSSVNCPADSFAGKHIPHGAGINSSFPGGAFRDVGHISGWAQRW